MAVKIRRRRLLPLLVLALLPLAAWGWSRRIPSAAGILAAEGRMLDAVPAARAAHDRGEEASERGVYPEARRGFETAIRLEPRSAVAHLNLGLVEARMGRRREAVRNLERATALRPRWGLAWRSLAKAYADAGQLPPAEEAARKSTELEPGAPEAWIGHAHVLLLRGDPAGAERSARRALRLDAARPDTWLSLGDVLLGAPGRDRAPEAADAFRRAAELEAGSYAYRRLGEALGRSGRRGEAVGAHREAVRLAPFDAAAAYQLSLSLRSAGEREEADRCAARARELEQNRYALATLERRAVQSPGDVDLQLRLGRAFARCGERRASIEAYRRALLLDPGHEAARRELARIESGAPEPRPH